MKNLLLFAAICAIAGCSLFKDASSHCAAYKTDTDINTGSFDFCLRCDSLADVVKKKAAEIKEKQAAKK